MAYFRAHFQPDIGERLSCAEIAAPQASIRVQTEGRPDWWRIGRDFAMIFRISRGNRWELTAPSLWPLNEDRVEYHRAHFRPDIVVAKCAKIEAGRLCSQRFGRDIPRIARISRTNHWGLTGPHSGPQSGIRMSHFRSHIQPDIEVTKICQN